MAPVERNSDSISGHIAGRGAASGVSASAVWVFLFFYPLLVVFPRVFFFFFSFLGGFSPCLPSTAVVRALEICEATAEGALKPFFALTASGGSDETKA